MLHLGQDGNLVIEPIELLPVKPDKAAAASAP